MSRDFQRREIIEGNRVISTYRIECGRCGVITKVHGRIPNVVIGKKFTERGWFVGRDASEDRCPQHRRTAVEPVAPDPEKPIVDRINRGIQNLEDALHCYSKIENPKSSPHVMASLAAFHDRVFGEEKSSEVI